MPTVQVAAAGQDSAVAVVRCCCRGPRDASTPNTPALRWRPLAEPPSEPPSASGCSGCLWVTAAQPQSARRVPNDAVASVLTVASNSGSAALWARPSPAWPGSHVLAALASMRP